MATGISVDDNVLAAYNDMVKYGYVGVSTNETEKKKKAIVLRLSPDLKTLTIEEGKEMLVSDCNKVDDAYKHFFDRLPKDDCRYVVYNISFETKENKREARVFIFWKPDSAPLKNKMVYASSKDAVQRKLVGISLDIEANKLEDVQDRRAMATKLKFSNIISFEGKPL